MTDEERVQRLKGQYLKSDKKPKKQGKSTGIEAKSHITFFSNGGKLSTHKGAI